MKQRNQRLKKVKKGKTDKKKQNLKSLEGVEFESKSFANTIDFFGFGQREKKEHKTLEHMAAKTFEKKLMFDSYIPPSNQVQT